MYAALWYTTEVYLTTVFLLQNWSLFECTIALYCIWICEFYSIVQRALKFGQTTIIKPLQIGSPLAVCVHVYWKGILVQRVGVHTYEFGLNFPRGSREGEEDLNLRRKWGSIIPTCNTIFKLMIYKQHARTHVHTKLQSKHLEDVFKIEILKCSTRKIW